MKIVITQKALCTVATVSLDNVHFSFEGVNPRNISRISCKIRESVSDSHLHLVVPGAPFWRTCGYEEINGYKKMFIILDFNPDPPFTQDELKEVEEFWEE